MHPPLATLPNTLKKFPLIQAAYIFGSIASGKERKDSDLDLGIFPRSPEIRNQRLDILQELAKEGFSNVDLVFLDTDNIVLKYEAIRQNKLIYHTEDFDRGSTYSLIVRQYLDFLPFLRTQRQAYKRKILNGKTRSNHQTSSKA
jgi:uncharacterized protein